MYWTLELASKLEDAPWPATKDELIDYAIRSGAPLEVLENLKISGLIILQKKTSCLTKTSTKRKQKRAAPIYIGRPFYS